VPEESEDQRVQLEDQVTWVHRVYPALRENQERPDPQVPLGRQERACKWPLQPYVEK